MKSTLKQFMKSNDEDIETIAYNKILGLSVNKRQRRYSLKRVLSFFK